MKCEICEKEEATKDAKLQFGPWANVCEKCFNKYGVKIKGTFTTFKNIEIKNRTPYSD
jgi:ribosome-binding protein aMBF1 (putative translation factor)